MHKAYELRKLLEKVENSGFGEELKNIQDNVERVRFVQNTDEFKARYQQATRFQNEPKKNTSRSDLYREKGNQYYAEQKFILAIEYFNASICFAQERSEQLAKAHANRSAVYFMLKMFELSLKNIKMARESGCSESLVSRLDEREAKCVKEIEKLKTDPKKEFKGLKPELSYPPHEKIPYIANCLDFKVNEKYGRHIITKVDLKVGDVVAIERPFSAAISSTARYTACANCFRQNNLHLIPCPNCHAAMFCNPECLATANEAFHAIECPIMDIIVGSGEIDYHGYAVLRLFLVAMKSFESVDELMQFTKDVEHREQNVFMSPNNERTQNVDLLASILKLKVQPAASKKIHILFNTDATALTTEVLMNLTDFKESFKSDKESNFLIKFIFRLYELTTFNVIYYSGVQITEPGMEHPRNYQLGGPCFGCYLVSSLLNHSCAPNVRAFTHGTERAIIVMKPIKSGEQLFHSFDPDHVFLDRKIRQEILHAMFGLTCDCIACIRDYPQAEQRDAIQSHGFIEPMHHMKLCDEHQIEALKELIPKYCKYLNEHSEEFPYNHTIVAEHVLCKSLEVLFLDELPLVEKIRLQFK